MAPTPAVRAPTWTPPRSAMRALPSITGPRMRPAPRSELVAISTRPYAPRRHLQGPIAAQTPTATVELTVAASISGVPDSSVLTTSASPTRIVHPERRAFAVARLRTARRTLVSRVAIVSSIRTAAATTARHRPCPRRRNAEKRARICSPTIATPRRTRASTTPTASSTEAVWASVSTTRRRGAGRAVHRRAAHHDSAVDRRKTDDALGAHHLDTRARGGR
jgi:hypothetical protein